jgi:predicted dinucleotide-binding enzyme
MKITTIGRGNVGGGLARVWRAAGHEVQELGRDGGDASGADVVVVAVPGGTVEEALAKVEGLHGKTVIDATNVISGREARDDAHESNAHKIKSIVGGPTAKAFNLNFMILLDEISKQRVRPSNLYAADDEAREVTEQLTRDAGYDPVYAGGLDQARALEEHLALMFAVNRIGGLGPFFYRMAKPGDL